ncbi:hypothetical protein N7499_004116 [Penicillium canescens]|nr:hypothetical protein N7499_004116 [Penicillium canescens]
MPGDSLATAGPKVWTADGLELHGISMPWLDGYGETSGNCPSNTYQGFVAPSRSQDFSANAPTKGIFRVFIRL